MLIRCENHPSQKYQHAVDPIGYPKTAAICGRCDRPGKALLSDSEFEEYQSGKTVFGFNSNVIRVEVVRKDGGSSNR